MYVLPASLDPNYLNSQVEGRTATESIQMMNNLQAIRALPAKAGSILGWTHALFHWGSRSSLKAENPRISLSVEFQRGDIAPYETGLLDPLVLPTFSQRLHLIGRQILKYRHMYNLSDSLCELADELAQLPVASAQVRG
jgi:hypothetical protein